MANFWIGDNSEVDGDKRVYEDLFHCLQAFAPLRASLRIRKTVTNKERLTSANLVFFKKTLWEPMLESQGTRTLAADKFVPRTVAILSLMELTYWIRIGVEIGFFDPKQSLDLVLTGSQQIQEGWSILAAKNALPLVKAWCNFTVQEGYVDIEGFLNIREPNLSRREIKYADFQNFLLLSSETVSDHIVLDFLEAVGWWTDTEWLTRFTDRAEWLSPSHYFLTGFRGVLGHLEGLHELIWHPNNLWRSDPAKEQLAQAVGGFERTRLGFGTLPEAVDRYFQVAGTFLPRSLWEENTDADVPRSVFQALRRLTMMWHDQEVGAQDRLWREFLRSANKRGIRYPLREVDQRH